jgi:hypothetical protein
MQKVVSLARRDYLMPQRDPKVNAAPVVQACVSQDIDAALSAAQLTKNKMQQYVVAGEFK